MNKTEFIKKHPYRYYQISDYLKETFGKKVIKLSINSNLTCPNRDGSKGTGGCIFCSEQGSGDTASNIPDQIKLLKNKWPNASYITYFQNFTNTYAPVDILRKNFYEALEHTNVLGIAISTRPDCLNEDVLELLEEINKKYFLWIELGLQSASDKTLDFLNTKYTCSDFENAAAKLTKLNIPFVTHIILGLPNENKSDMINSINLAVKNRTFGLKLHMLNIIKGTKLHDILPDYIPFQSIDEYTDLVVNLLKIIPQNITIHRLTADVLRKDLIAPAWSFKKRSILNEIYRKLNEKDLFQGCDLI